MNSFYKVCVKTAVVLIIIGSILTITGVACGASWNTINNAPAWFNLDFVNFFVSQDTNDNSNNILEEDGEPLYETYKDVKSIEIDVDFGEVIIKQGNEFKIESKNIYNDEFESYMSGDTLVINHDNGSWFEIFNFRGNEDKHINGSPEITLYIPKDFHAEDLDISLGAGYMQIEKISADNVTIDAGTGAVNVQSVIVLEEGYFSVGAGEIKVTDIQADNAEIDCGVGNIKMTGLITGESDVSCGVGKVVLDLKGDEKDYNYNVDCGLGSIKINDRSYRVSESAVVENDNARNEFNVDCGMGSVTINIKQ